MKQALYRLKIRVMCFFVDPFARVEFDEKNRFHLHFDCYRP